MSSRRQRPAQVQICSRRNMHSCSTGLWHALFWAAVYVHHLSHFTLEIHLVAFSTTKIWTKLGVPIFFLAFWTGWQSLFCQSFEDWSASWIRSFKFGHASLWDVVQNWQKSIIIMKYKIRTKLMNYKHQSYRGQSRRITHKVNYIVYLYFCVMRLGVPG